MRDEMKRSRGLREEYLCVLINKYERVRHVTVAKMNDGEANPLPPSLCTGLHTFCPRATSVKKSDGQRFPSSSAVADTYLGLHIREDLAHAC